MATQILTPTLPPLSSFWKVERSLPKKYMSISLCFVSLWMLLQIAECDNYVGEVNCTVSPYEIKACSMNKTCSGVCVYSCQKNGEGVWGSGIYTHDSSICKSATHDRRISTWDTKKRSFVLRITSDYQHYWGSIRFGIHTKSYTELTYKDRGSFIFESPKINEEILEVASIHRRFLFELQQNHVQDCYAANVPDLGKFSAFVYVSSLKRSPRSIENLTPTLVRYTYSSPNSGGFQCVPDKSMLSVITSVAMRSDAYFFPTSLTYTANAKDNVTLIMNKNPHISCDPSSRKTIWKKDGEALPEFVPESSKQRTTLTLISVQEGNQGLYSLECESLPERRGILRLIVRACPKDKYGDKCTTPCPECKNGGVCHDITGACICPPGYNGTLCEHMCPLGYFGRTCSIFCPKRDGLPSCHGLLICLPEPYGCSCGSGYKGISCDRTCDAGEFGAGCNQRRDCHCSTGLPCDIHSGLCPSGCDDGWHGDGCAISYPVLTAAPVLLNSTKNSITLSFREWDSTLDIGSGDISTYRIHFMEKCKSGPSAEWNYKDAALSHDAGKKQIVVTLDGLKPGTEYAVQVEIIVTSGQSQRNGLTTSKFSTLCGKPQEPPTNIEVSSTEREVSISWALPPRISWNCKTLETVVKYKSFNFTAERVVPEYNYSFPSKPYTYWNVSVCLRPSSDVAADITCSDPRNVTTKEDAPGGVGGFSSDLVNSREFSLKWEDPPEKNGVIRYFILRYKQTGWKHTCNMEGYDSSNKELNVTSRNCTLRSLNPSAIYVVSLSAVTVREGPPRNLYIDTAADVPSAGPTLLTFNSQENYLIWKNPLCNMTNGQITGYWITMKGSDPWSEKEINMTTRETHIQLSELVPHTRYNVKVFASTKTGLSKIYSGLTFTTDPKEPPSPRNVTIYSRNKNSLHLAWLPPYPPHGELWKYEIRYAISNSSSTKKVSTVLPPECNSVALKGYQCYNLTNLKNGTSYSIEIRAFNKNVYTGGEYSKVITGVTSESKPEPPTAPDVAKRNETSITIKWEEPKITNGILQSYRVNMTLLERYSLPEEKSQFVNRMEEIPASKTEFTFNKLWPATIYSLTIEARTSAGYGPALNVTVSTSILKPVIDREPQFLSKTADSITIKIFPAQPTGGPISAYFVIVKSLTKRTRSKRYATNFFTSRDCLVLLDEENRYAVAKLYTVPLEGKVFTVGDGTCNDGYFNQPLTSGFYYRIGIAVRSEFGDEEKYSDIKYVAENILIEEPETADDYGTVLGILIFLIIATCILILVFVKKPHLLQKAKQKASQTLHLIPRRAKMLPETEPDLSYANATLEDDDFIETESLSEDVCCVIPVKDLEDVALRGIENGDIKKQHKALSKGEKFPCLISRIPENRSKNRYGNLLPYDHSRVKLATVPGDPHSDYINANYVSGYKKEKKYIATQGPMSKTVNDFWRMVWKEKSCKVLMATRLFEAGRVKCDKYWPDDTGTFGSITITLKHCQQQVDYITRTFEISNGKETRELKHFHFLTWPDHGVPMYTSPVLKFLKKVRDYQPDNKAPVIVHCSAGVGRTGTLILLDSMLEMGNAEGRVDVCGHLSLMRRERNNFVENLEQYVFVYKALVQSLCWGESSVLCSEIIPQIKKLRTPDHNTYFSPVEVQYQRLSKIFPKLDNVAVRVAREPENVPKNRTMEILPPERARPLMKPTSEGGGSPYINAVYVNGYKDKDAFIATQFPLPNTVSDFWRMIRDTKSRTIVLLQEIDFADPTCPRYWPCDGESMVHGELLVQCTSMEIQGDIHVWLLNLSTLNSEDDSAVPIKLFHHLNWATMQPLPQHPSNILDLIDNVEKALQKCGKHIVTVQCRNGSTACGVFCAAMFLCGKMINEQEVDVFLAVQNIRANRPQFIECFEQYDFLYDLAITFLDNFGAYANFL